MDANFAIDRQGNLCDNMGMTAASDKVVYLKRTPKGFLSPEPYRNWLLETFPVAARNTQQPRSKGDETAVTTDGNTNGHNHIAI